LKSFSQNLQAALHEPCSESSTPVLSLRLDCRA
jgi:hypothetical protein